MALKYGRWLAWISDAHLARMGEGVNDIYILKLACLDQPDLVARAAGFLAARGLTAGREGGGATNVR
jgi:hypothetical protein